MRETSFTCTSVRNGEKNVEDSSSVSGIWLKWRCSKAGSGGFKRRFFDLRTQNWSDHDFSVELSFKGILALAFYHLERGYKVMWFTTKCPTWRWECLNSTWTFTWICTNWWVPFKVLWSKQLDILTERRSQIWVDMGGEGTGQWKFRDWPTPWSMQFSWFLMFCLQNNVQVPFPLG